MLRLNLSQAEQEELDKVSAYYTPLLNEVFDKITSAIVAWNNMEIDAREGEREFTEEEKRIVQALEEAQKLKPYEQKLIEEYQAAESAVYKKAEERSHEFYAQHPDELLKAITQETYDEVVRASIEAIQKKTEVNDEQVRATLFSIIESYLPALEKTYSDGRSLVLRVCF